MSNVENLLIYKQNEPFTVKVERFVGHKSHNAVLQSVYLFPLREEASNDLIQFPVVRISTGIKCSIDFIKLNESLLPELYSSGTYIEVDIQVSSIRFVFYKDETIACEIVQQVPSNIVDVIHFQRDPYCFLFLDDEGKIFTMNLSSNKLDEPMKLLHIPFDGKITRMNRMSSDRHVLAALYDENDRLILIFGRNFTWSRHSDNCSVSTFGNLIMYYLRDHPPVKFFDSGTVLLMNGELHHYNFRFRRNLGKRISEYVLNIDSPTYEEFLNNENCLIAREVKEFSVRMHIIASTTHDHIPDEIPDLEVEYSFGYLIDIRNNLWIWNNEYQCVEKNPRFLGSDFTGFSPERRPMLVKSSRS